MAKANSERVRRIEELVRRLEDLPGESREIAQSLMEAVLELHGAGLERMMDLVFQAGDVGEATIRRFAGDDLVSNLLVLHDLHPDDIETRVQHALGKMHGDAELLGVFEGIVRVRLTAGGRGVRESVEAAIREAVPDAAEIVISESMAPSGFVPLAALMV
jgi:hypothetical protein